MRRRRADCESHVSYRWIAVLVCLFGVALTPSSVMAAGADRPNILLILSDDHSVPHLGCYGNAEIKTPNLDRVAAQGMRFDRMYTCAPQCMPSRAAIMTGRSPVATAMTRFSAPLPAEIITFPELLMRAGYYAGVAGRHYHLDGATRFDVHTEILDEHNLRTFKNRLDYVKVAGHREEMLAQYSEFLDAVPAGKPFFLQLCFSDPHRPLDANAIPEPHDPAKLTLPAHYPDTPAIREDFARYYDEISRMDGCVGQVLAELDERKLSENTLVVFMGDNGAAQLRGKGTLYEFGLNVPLLIRWPGVIKLGTTTRELISGEDLAPTFLQAVGLDVPAEMTGKSFLPLLKGQPFDGRTYVFGERGAHGSGLPHNSAVFDLGRCVISKRYKLIYNALWQIPFWPVDFAGDRMWKELVEMNADGKLSEELSRVYFSPTRPMFELYDLETDPREFDNLIGQKKAIAIERELKKTLIEWMILERDCLPLPTLPNPQRKSM